ncbi:MAG: hypothetical protein ACRC7O_02595 [Fimbriiglobus sp.]
MTPNLRGLALFTALAVTISAASTPVTAQDKKPAPAKDAKDAKAAPSRGKATGTIEIAESKNGKFRFGIRDADGKYLCGSLPSAFATKEEAAEALEKLKSILATAKPTERKADEDK